MAAAQPSRPGTFTAARWGKICASLIVLVVARELCYPPADLQSICRPPGIAQPIATGTTRTPIEIARGVISFCYKRLSQALPESRINMPPDDIPSVRQLRIFAAVAAAQSVSGAAKAVNLSQPGVTQSVRAL